MSTLLAVVALVAFGLVCGWLENHRPGSWKPLRLLVIVCLLINAWSLTEGLWEQDWPDVAWGVFGSAACIWWALRLSDLIEQRQNRERFLAYLAHVDATRRWEP